LERGGGGGGGGGGRKRGEKRENYLSCAFKRSLARVWSRAEKKREKGKGKCGAPGGGPSASSLVNGERKGKRGGDPL